ncbi:glycerophosphodiester phosphodiesterase [Chitinophaga sp. W3I9]|uniref:glycerophosphodiester phosphodiesterase n=1 Tax=Chitinophaga sp. W3I9 TaxID=3373924 RepID=UPI003D231FAF
MIKRTGSISTWSNWASHRFSIILTTSWLTPELVSKCHAKHIKIVPWTVDDVNEMKKLKALGVDGIITDYPNRLREAGL